MAIRKSSNSGIPFGNTANRPANPSDGQPYFNGELQRLELYTGATYGWQNIVAETPGVTGYTGTVYELTGGTITITGTNFAAGAAASFIGANGTEYNATSTTINNLTSITAVVPPLSGDQEPYDIKVTNPSNLYGVYYDVLTVNDDPIWTTAAGSLGTINGNSTISLSVAATDEESNTITYSSSNLPAWLILNSSTGALTGTAPNPSSNTTYSFNITASDAGNSVSRAFSLTVNPVAIVTGGTLSSDSTYYYRTFTANASLQVSNVNLTGDILMIAGGGGGQAGGAGGGGGGAGGVIYAANYSLPINTYPITVGAGGTAGTVSVNGSDGINTTFNTTSLVANGGGRGGYKGDPNGDGRGASGGSGGGAGRDCTGAGGTATQGSGTGFVGYGNAGGFSQSSGYGAAAGGGGAGGVGGNGPTNGPGIVSGTGGNPGDYPAGPGGSGLNTWSSWLTAITSQMTGVSGWATATSGGFIAGGGGGGAFQPQGNVSAAGGSGGGGAGARGGDGRAGWSNPLVNADPGITNTGSGGGGAYDSQIAGLRTSAAAGGSGIVIVRYTRASVGG